MTNKELANTFNELAKIMELYGENPFKIRSYSTAYVNIRKQPEPLIEKSKEALLAIPGIGNAIADKIVELRETGEIKALQKYVDKTPPGIIELMKIKGFGPKKIRVVWDELGIESPGELLYACSENRLVELKGFGAKTQETLIGQLTYYLDSAGKYLYGHIIDEAHELIDLLKLKFSDSLFYIGGDLYRKIQIVGGIDILTNHGKVELMDWLKSVDSIEWIEENPYYKGSRVFIREMHAEKIVERLFTDSASEEFLEFWHEKYGEPIADNVDAFNRKNLAYIPPEVRELPSILHRAASSSALNLIQPKDIKGVVHAHSTYSDGANTLAQMAEASRSAGYEYLVITDHSKAAFYANGLTEQRVLAQIEEIDAYNLVHPDFRIFKGIECDILYDGELDYDDEFLKVFDVVIISIHSNLKMDQSKATDRLLRAIEHPASKILGHPTGRLLLSREGYPIDHERIIHACEQHHVAIEINASPYRLDLDWKWASYAREIGVKISINPDAHSIAGINDIRFGVDAARKAGLQPFDVINTLNATEFEQWIRS